ncbi:MAG: hypothetical protein WKG07_10680 [Hymenobacter sp.]
MSFRTALFQPLEADTILDDFVQSMRIVAAGHRVVYEPEAYAMELPSFSLDRGDEAQGAHLRWRGWQAMSRLLPLLNPLQYPTVSFLYISHRVLRWSLTPLLLALLLPLNGAAGLRLRRPVRGHSGAAMLVLRRGGGRLVAGGPGQSR